jgi:hypothetical protein
LQCKAGGTYSAAGGTTQHINGQMVEFDYFLKSNEAFIDLSRRFTWVKCNRDFKGYYVTEYLDANYEIFNFLLSNDDNVLSKKVFEKN